MLEVDKVKRLVEFYRDRPKEEEDNVIVVRALEFYIEYGPIDAKDIL